MDVCGAVDLGATNLRCALMNREGDLFGFSRESVAGFSGKEITDTIIRLTQSAIDETGLSPSAIGISTAGPVDLKRGAVLNSPNMQADEVALVRPIQERFNLPTVMLTDCKAGAYGEYVFGGHGGAETLVYLTMSTGIGSGVVSGGSVFHGSDGNAGEMGHCVVDTVYNMPCGCGGFGHWEAYSSGSRMPLFFAEWKKRRGVSCECEFSSSKEILEAARQGAAAALEFVREVSQMNHRGLSTLVCAYNPDVIVLDGPLCREYSDLLIAGVDEYLRVPEICVTKLDGNAPLLGAGAYAFSIL